MRIYLFLDGTNQLVPFNYQSFLTGAFHKWLGQNELHNETSQYNFSWLRGGAPRERGLSFRHGAEWFISSPSEDVLRKIVGGIMDDPEVCYGLKVANVSFGAVPEFGDEARLRVASPVLVKHPREDGSTEHLLFHDPRAGDQLTATMHHRLRRIGIADPDIRVDFDPEYARPSTKMIEYHQVKNRVNLCPVVLRGNPAHIALAYDLGVGNSTGIGFGALE